MTAKMKLTQLNLLELFSDENYADILAGFRERQFGRKELICTPYDGNDSIFIVKSGRLRVFLSYEDREFTLALLEQGDIFSTHTQAYAEALDNSVILTGQTRVFHSKIQQYPQIMAAVVKVLGELLKNSTEIIESLVFKDVRQRLYDFLHHAALERGVAQGEGMLVDLGLSAEDLALLIGTTRQTVSTLINELIRDGKIEKVGRFKLLIHDLSAFRSEN